MKYLKLFEDIESESFYQTYSFNPETINHVDFTQEEVSKLKKTLWYLVP